MNMFFIAVIVALIIIGLLSLSGNTYLETEAANPAEAQGTYTLLLYGCKARSDLANVAILDKEGDPYSFEIHAPDLLYTVKTGMNAAEALQEAERFVRCNIQCERTVLRRILSPANAVVGFELRPLYAAETFGRDDIIDVRYAANERKIVVHIELDAAIARQRAN